MTGPGWAVVLAVAAAAAYASGAVVQQRAATAPAGGSQVGPTLLEVLRRPLWFVGVGFDAAGFGLEFLALRAGTVTLVQPLLVSGLLFALPLGAVFTGLRIGLRDVAAAALVTVGLTVSVLVAAPSPGRGTAGTGTWVMTLVVAGAVVGGLALLAMHRRPVVRAVNLAAAAAVVNGLLASFGKALALRSEGGWPAALLSWPALGLVVSAALTLTLAAAAFRAGAPTAAIGVLFAAEPAAGVIMGAVLFGDTIRHGPLTVAVLVLGLLTCGSGVSLLAKSPVVVASYAPTRGGNATTRPQAPPGASEQPAARPPPGIR